MAKPTSKPVSTKKPTVNGLSTCGNCYYYRKTNAKVGYCHRFPPAVIAVDEDGTVLSESPVIGQERDACGEYTQGPRVVN